ncbi:hypothetical protein KY348_02495 [Candidatus Woesearchaeota archaeon]|nr:hypothetical protein [Candidatus Woesearchaeota archaeon]
MDIETRIGNYSGSVDELVSHYSKDFFEIPFYDPKVVKRALVVRDGSNNYQVIISKDNRNPFYNIMVTIVGPNIKKIKEIIKDLGEKLPIELEPAPELTKQFHKDMIRVASLYYNAKNN